MKQKTFILQPLDSGFEILLNHDPVVTPAGKPLVAPTKPLAQKLIDDLTVDIQITLPLQLTYTALDQPPEIMVPDCLHFLTHDCVLYWPKDSDEQAQYLEKHLAPILRAIAERTDCVLSPSSDLSPPQIPERLITFAKQELNAFTPYARVAFREITTMLGSYLLAHLLYHNQIELEEAIRLSLIEQHFQRQKWGTVDTHEDVEGELKKHIKGCVDYLSLCA